MYKQPTLGILGGGQLGRMLLPYCASLNIKTSILDSDPNAPCSELTSHFKVGSLLDYQTVIDFGKGLDFITIEIEKVNTEALEVLQKQGVQVFPQPEIIRIIQDKRLQKQFYKEHNIPTSDFVLTENREDVTQYLNRLPAVHKIARDGYDGRGVAILKTEKDLSKAFDAQGILEDLVDIETEISIITARNKQGEITTFPAVALVYHEQNLVDYLLAPADISAVLLLEADKLARLLTEKLGLVGILAIELFVTKSGEILVNEVAPRPHNSGHQTIEANITSQYEQLIRAVTGLPLGKTSAHSASAMLNVLGSENHTGEAVYQGIEEVLKMENVHLHLYGKQLTKPFRKMGHITVLGKNKTELINKIENIKKVFSVVSA